MVRKEDCSVYFQTIQTNVMKVLFEGLKDLITDVNMAFTTKGIKILQMDAYSTLMVDLFIDKNKIEEYYCPKDIEIGISIPSLYKKFKTMSSDCILTMYMSKNNNSLLEIIIERNDSKRRTEFTLDLLDLSNSEALNFPEDEYNLYLTMSSQTFKEICQETKSIETKQIKITYSKGIYTFSAKGTLGPQTITLPCEEKEKDKKSKENEIYEGTFDLEKLSSFTKCSSITKNVKFLLGNDLPLICEYELSCGTLHLLLGLLDDN